MFFFFFKQKTAYEMRISDWSSDVCSSDLREDRENTEGPDLETGDVRRLLDGVLVVAECVEEAEIGPADDLETDFLGVAGDSGAEITKQRLLHLFGRVHQERQIDDRSEEHTSELQSLMRISSAIFCM